MRALIDNIQKSIYDPAYYQALLTKPLRQSVKYFAAFALLISVFLTIISSIPIVINANKFAHEFPAQFFDYVPDELQITVANGIAVSSVVEPYFLSMPTFPEDWNVDDKSNGALMAHLAVIDTATPFSMDKFKEYGALIWVGRDQVVIRDDGGGVKIQPFPKEANFVVNEAIMRDIEHKIAPYYRYIGPAIVIVIFLVLSIGIAFNFAYLLFGALLIMMLGYVLKQRFTFAVAYRLGLHALTLPLLIDTLLAMSSLSFMRIPFIPTFIMLAVIYANFKDAPHTMPESAVAPIPDAPEDQIE